MTARANPPATPGRPRTWPPTRWLALAVSAAVVLGGIGAGRAADAPPKETKEKPAKLIVDGAGLLQNRRLRTTLRQLQRQTTAPRTYGVDFIEDAALLLLRRMQADGYLRVEIEVDLALADGSRLTNRWQRASQMALPRPLAAREVRFRVAKGRFYYYDRLEFTGLIHLPEREARAFFYPVEALVSLPSFRPYSPTRLQSSAGNLRQALVNQGFRDATVRAENAVLDDDTGAVRLEVRVKEGVRHRVQEVRIERETRPDAAPEVERRPSQAVFSPLWEQDLRHELTSREFALGYPDARATLSVTNPTPRNGELWVTVQATVDRGPRVALGETRFQGQQRTRESLLRRETRLDGPWLNRLAVDRGRERLARLGVFRAVDVETPAAGPDRRDVVFEVAEGKRLDVSLLFGYGSYDQLFGGVELAQKNVFGLAHSVRLEAVQSFKTTRGSTTYSIPDFAFRDTTLYLSAKALHREEISFTREEGSASVGLRRLFPDTAQQVGVHYAFELLNAVSAPAEYSVEGRTKSGSVGADWQVERRDNPLLPRRGYHATAGAEVALPELGGDAYYARAWVTASYHLPLWNGGFAHVGVTHGVAAPLGGDPTELPFNRRFFPGGENTVRGYREGGASPLNELGQQIGAESSLIGNVELEQLITGSISVVGFVDGAGVTPDIARYPFDEVLWSVGGGLRWRTVIGPVRLEYGYNLNRRPFDPSGTLQLSLGYPF